MILKLVSSGIAFKTLKKNTVKNRFGYTLLTETYVYTGTSEGYQQIGWQSYTHDDFGRIVQTEDSRGNITSAVWGCCVKESATNEQGITTNYTHDALKQVETETRPGPNGDITTTYTYDASGRVLSEITSEATDTLTLSTGRTYDSVGRLKTVTDARGLVTTYTYENNGLKKTVTHPGGFTEITENYIGGQVKSISGTAVIPQYYTYGVNTDGTRWTTASLGASDSARWEKTVTDLLGRTIRTEKPGAEGTEIYETVYNSAGQVSKNSEPGKADVLYAYDDIGRQTATALDVNSDSIISEDGTDRVTQTETLYVKINDEWHRKTTESTFLEAGSGVSTTIGITREKFTGLASGIVSQTEFTDAHGNVTLSTTAINRAAATVTQTTDAPDSDIDSTTVTANGYTQSSTDKTGLTVTYVYDNLGRRTQTISPKTGTVTTHFNALGQVSAVDAPAGKSVTYGYDATSGRKITETNAESGVTRYAYNDRGQITHTWGNAATPVLYEYDTYGSLRKMHTYRQGDNWNNTAWPTDAGEGDVTTWNYDDASGLLDSKTYADGKGTAYSYLAGGRLHTRTWARTIDGSALVTTYDYDSATGELTGIDYSDDTTDITFTYDRAGRKTNVTDALGTRTFVYDGMSLDSETITGLYNRTVEYSYETAEGTVGRPSSFNIGTNYQINYGYENGRINSLDWQTGSRTGNAGYTYQNGLIQQLQFQNGPTVTNTYDLVERYRTQVKNEGSSGIISQYDYTHDNLGRRETVTYSGSAFTDGESYRRFSYNDRSEVIESSAYSGSDINSTASPILPEHRAYQYDPIGNRMTAIDWDETAEAEQTKAYTANELNQYSEITINSETDSPVYDDDGNLLQISTDGTLMTYNGENRLTTSEIKASEGDVNGDGIVNLADAIASLQAVAGMNSIGVQLIGDISTDNQIGLEEAVFGLQVTAGLREAKAAQQLVFAYDYQGRRVSKQVFSRNEAGTGWKTEPEKTVLFVWKGWNLAEEITKQGEAEASRYFVNGLDLSQSFQEAGGIGGLLSLVDGDSAFYYLYDANGNVGQLVDADDGSVAACYLYDAFGKTVTAEGVYAVGNPFRFSTKYWDDETKLGYWGYRYYSPEQGRWLRRDPIEEEGGLNIYAYAQNMVFNFYDLLGLECKIAWDDNCTKRIGNPWTQQELDEGSYFGALMRFFAFFFTEAYWTPGIPDEERYKDITDFEKSFFG